MRDNRLKEIREAKGLSQLKLSYLTEISPSCISQIERGRLYPYPNWRRKISEVLDVREEDLFFSSKNV